MKKIALVGNPNCGKTSIFNLLTGLNQKVGNYPGVTVDKRSGKYTSSNGESTEIIDLPGTYSLSSNSIDEELVQKILLNPDNTDYPDGLLMVVDATNLQRNLFLASQIYDLEIPMILVVNMIDVIDKIGEAIDLNELSSAFACQTIAISAKTKHGLDELRENINNFEFQKIARSPFLALEELCVLEPDVPLLLPNQNNYQRFKILNQIGKINWIPNKEKLENLIQNRASGFALEIQEINARYQKISALINKIKPQKNIKIGLTSTQKIDKIVLHPFFGLLTFLATFFILFQAIFTLSAYPMNWIDSGIAWFGSQIATLLPEGLFNDFLVNGVITGVGGVLVFLPQIMLLFGMITLLEDTGYLARISHMSDGLLKKFGMNGKSVVPLVSGFACAIPAIMAARTIENKKERLITIFITPLMSCSARLPVYVFLVSFIVPNETILGIFNFQGLMMMALYLLGLAVSFIVALIINFFLKSKEQSTFILELPNYKKPALQNMMNSMLNKGGTFVKQAGKVILIAAIAIWALGNVVPETEKQRIASKYDSNIAQANKEDKLLLESQKKSELLEYSYLGSIGKTIEPVIRPLGFDWKIGIAIAASFAAREVFVGTMATIYAVEDNAESQRGLKAITFSYPVAFSLLIFYVFALQCMSTIAIVRQETGGWKWPFLQFVSFTGLAYFAAWLTFILAS